MRYLWELYPEYLRDWTRSAYRRLALAAFSGPLRVWDYAAAARVDEFIANSHNVRRRIWKTYRRESRVVHPPVDVEGFYWRRPGDYYLVVSELVGYKRVEDAVTCFSRTGRRLKVVGEGPELKRLQRLGGGNVEFCGRVPVRDLRELYARCRALVMPGEEDFGMVAVEALASGKCVIALGRGGVLESVPPEAGRGGVFYDEPGDRQLEEALTRFELREAFVQPASLQSWVKRFSEARFQQTMRRIIGLGGAIPQRREVAV